jgi:hypothetical protein
MGAERPVSSPVKGLVEALLHIFKSLKLGRRVTNAIQAISSPSSHRFVHYFGLYL